MEKLKFGTVDEEFSLTGKDIKLLNSEISWLDVIPANLDSFKPHPNHVLDEAGIFPFKKDYMDSWSKIVKATN